MKGQATTCSLAQPQMIQRLYMFYTTCGRGSEKYLILYKMFCRFCNLYSQSQILTRLVSLLVGQKFTESQDFYFYFYFILPQPLQWKKVSKCCQMAMSLKLLTARIQHNFKLIQLKNLHFPRSQICSRGERERESQVMYSQVVVFECNIHQNLNVAIVYIGF